MKTTKEILEDLQKEVGKKLGGIAVSINRKPQVLYDIRDGVVKSISFELATDISNKYKSVNKDFLMTGKGSIKAENNIPETDIYSQTIHNLSIALLKSNSSNEKLVEQNGKALDKILSSLDALVEASSSAPRTKQRRDIQEMRPEDKK